MAMLSGAGCGSGCGCGASSQPEVQPLEERGTSAGPFHMTITDKAADKVKDFMRDMPGTSGKQLRIAIRAGGCSGYSYDFVFDTKRDGDHEIAAKDISVLIDPMSMKLLKGSKVDYIESMQGAGFVVDNPNSSGGCGCGSSFSA